ncbi:unnamed protein product, partial [Staurois parvus]
WAQQVYRPGNTVHRRWGPLIMGTAGVQTREYSPQVVGTPHNGHSKCADLGTQPTGGGNPS